MTDNIETTNRFREALRRGRQIQDRKMYTLGALLAKKDYFTFFFWKTQRTKLVHVLHPTKTSWLDDPVGYCGVAHFDTGDHVKTMFPKGYRLCKTCRASILKELK